MLATALWGCSEHEVVVAADVVSESEDTAKFCWPSDPKVDVLFVIDDSASMATEAAKLAASLAKMSEFLNGPTSCPYELRVAVTTTSTCEGEAGSFVSSSCRTRLADFVTDPSEEAPAADVRDAACTDVCPLDAIDLEPSLVEGFFTPERRPWLQAGRHGNLSDDLKFSDALACIVPVGLSGCSRETPLLALRSALERSRDPDDPQRGFLRSDASLFVVIVSDEDEPEADVSPAVDMLRAIEKEKHAANPDAEVGVAVLGGVGQDYSHGFFESLSCVAGDEPTPPPINLIRFLTAVTGSEQREVYSSCATDYSPVLASLARTLVEVLPSPCLNLCVADRDPSTSELDADCHATRTEIVSDAGIVETIQEPLHPCLPDGAGSWMPPPGESRCLDVVGDTELDQWCADQGWNASYRVFSIAPSGPKGAQCIEVTCRVSLVPEIDCPDL